MKTRGARRLIPLLIAAVLSGCGGSNGAGPPPVAPTTTPPSRITVSQRISNDPFTNASSQHATQVEPSAFANGSTIVAAFQDGRFTGFGSADIGFATSLDAGATWNSGVLTGTTTLVTPPGAFDAVSDPAVAFDAAHATWLIASLPVIPAGTLGPAALISRSTDGMHWNAPVQAAPGLSASDKDWIACDNTASSPYYGHCYVESDDGDTGTIHISTSTDGGAIWGPALTTADQGTGIGGQPLVRSDGSVLVPIDDFNEQRVLAFGSNDGGATWSATMQVSAITDHRDAGGIRSNPLIAAGIDGANTVYIVWQDCRFRQNCAQNDLVFSTSHDGVTWNAPARVPIDSTSNSVDHFIPGLAVDRSTSGSTARIALSYAYYPDANCTAASCLLYIGFTQSKDGGASWSSALPVAGPMNLAWLAQTGQGAMIGDYMATVFSGGRPVPVFAVANVPSGGAFDEAMYVPHPGTIPQSFTAQRRILNERPVRGAASDHPPIHLRPLGKQ